MIPKGASPETYEPTPQQLVALSDSKLYIKVGSPDFPFEQKHLQTVLGQNRKITIVNMSDGAMFQFWTITIMYLVKKSAFPVKPHRTIR